MEYLLINHVPFGKTGKKDVFEVGDLWLEDIRAQVAALQPFQVTVAAPLADKLEVSLSGSFHLVEVSPAQEHFRYIPLPAYGSVGGLILNFLKLRRRLRAAIKAADVVQADYGGHPLPLGQLAWSWALGKKRVWIFDGADPVPRMELHTQMETRSLYRAVKRTVMKRFVKFCREAVSSADLVFSHNAAVRERFAEVWHSRCHVFDRSFVRRQDLIRREELEAAHARRLNCKRPLRLVVCGRQTPIKATDHVIRAMAIARQQNVNLELSIIGDGEAVEMYRKLSQRLGLAASVSFHGTVAYGAALFTELQSCDVMVVTNLTAELSRNVFLAMSRGMALVLYRNPATDHLIETCGAGVLVGAGDVRELASALIHLDADRQKLVHLTENGLAAASDNTIDQCHRKRAEAVLECVGA